MSEISVNETSVNAKLNFWCIVTLDDDKNIWIIRRSSDAHGRDVIPEISGEDNGMNEAWAKNKPAGVYRLRLKPWAYQTLEGEWDSGVDVVKVTELYTLAPQTDGEPE